MTEAIITAIISGLCVAIPTVVVAMLNNAKNNALQDERIKQVNLQIATLTDKVEKHNNFGLQLAKLETRVEMLERKL